MPTSMAVKVFPETLKISFSFLETLPLITRTNTITPLCVEYLKSNIRDLKLLKSGKDVNVMTKSAKHNPEYKKIGRVPYIMKAKKIIIIEGYMSITDKRIRELCNFTVFIDLDTNERMKRRTKFINIGYREKILLPMHKEHVEPTKGFANMIIDVEKYNDKEIQELVINQLKILKVL